MKIFITGGAGFIGCNSAAHFLEQGHTVVIYDNLSRKGGPHNLSWLQSAFGQQVHFVSGDIRHYAPLGQAIQGSDVVLHMASQVAVTTSVQNPREDFEINALGTFNVLEAVRHHAPEAAVIYASTNKVYGGMEAAQVELQGNRYGYADYPHGIPESYPLDFHSPYGCCYSEDTDILTRSGWKRFYELLPDDEVLTYNLECKVAEFQRPTKHFAFQYEGKMYVQTNRRLKTCVTPNHKMLVAWDCDHNELKNPRLVEARSIEGKPMAYLLAAEVRGGQEREQFILPEIKPGKHKHHFPARTIPMDDWLRFLGWYLSEGHCYQNQKTGNCTVTLTTHYRTSEALEVMKAIGLSPVVDNHHVTATSKQLYEYVRLLGNSHEKYIPQCTKELNGKHLAVLLNALLDGDGNKQSENSWRYTTVSERLANDVQEIAIKCGLAASLSLDKEGFYRVYMGTTRTAQCNLGENRSEWIDYAGMVFCVEVPNSIVLVRQNGYPYFSGNSKGAGDQYMIDYARIYGLRTLVFRQSCIYGRRQFGVEDQGWVAHFVIAAVLNRPISIYGDGRQVRDLLHVSDLIRAYELGVANIDALKGQAFNIGGGPDNTLSIWSEFGPLLARLAGRDVPAQFGDWRPGDQRVFVADIRKAGELLGWQPAVAPAAGIHDLYQWVAANPGLFS